MLASMSGEVVNSKTLPDSIKCSTMSSSQNLDNNENNDSTLVNGDGKPVSSSKEDLSKQQEESSGSRAKIKGVKVSSLYGKPKDGTGSSSGLEVPGDSANADITTVGTTPLKSKPDASITNTTDESRQGQEEPSLKLVNGQGQKEHTTGNNGNDTSVQNAIHEPPDEGTGSKKKGKTSSRVSTHKKLESKTPVAKQGQEVSSLKMVNGQEQKEQTTGNNDNDSFVQNTNHEPPDEGTGSKKKGKTSSRVSTHKKLESKTPVAKKQRESSENTKNRRASTAADSVSSEKKTKASVKEQQSDSVDQVKATNEQVTDSGAKKPSKAKSRNKKVAEITDKDGRKDSPGTDSDKAYFSSEDALTKDSPQLINAEIKSNKFQKQNNEFTLPRVTSRTNMSSASGSVTSRRSSSSLDVALPDITSSVSGVTVKNALPNQETADEVVINSTQVTGEDNEENCNVSLDQQGEYPSMDKDSLNSDLTSKSVHAESTLNENDPVSETTLSQDMIASENPPGTKTNSRQDTSENSMTTVGHVPSEPTTVGPAASECTAVGHVASEPTTVGHAPSKPTTVRHAPSQPVVIGSTPEPAANRSNKYADLPTETVAANSSKDKSCEIEVPNNSLQQEASAKAKTKSGPDPLAYQDIPLDDAVTQLNETLQFLRSTDTYSNELCNQKVACLIPFTTHKYAQVQFIQQLAQSDYIPWFKSMWKVLHEGDLYSDQEQLKLLKKAKGILWNASDKSPQICRQIGESGLVGYLIGDLRDAFLAVDKLQGDVSRSYLISGSLGILHNSIRHWADNRLLFRKAGAVSLLQTYLKSKNLMIKSKCLLILAYIIDEDENSIINASDSNIEYILKILQDALADSTHISPRYKYSCTELLQGLNHIAANDSNKEKLIQKGAIHLYVQFLNPECSAEEQDFACKGLWLLSFNDLGKEQINSNENYIQSLQRLQNSGDNNVSKAAAGVLWVVSGKMSETRSAAHIMISYQWTHQPLALVIKEKLQAAGFNVWMDVDNMSGDILESMAVAIENASIVLICMSHKYKESPSCRTEAEYARKLMKPVVPIKMERNYTPDGWLGLITGTLLYFDFSQEERIIPEFQRLLKELKNRGMFSSHKHNTVQRIAAVDTAVVKSSYESHPPHFDAKQASSTCSRWSKDDVIDWLDQIDLKDVLHRLHGADGGTLVELYNMSQEAPEFYFNCLKTDLALDSVVAILHFNKQLRKLCE